MTEHLETASLARYLGGAGTPNERARWEAHLSECPDCREEMVEVRRIRDMHLADARYLRGGIGDRADIAADDVRLVLA